MGGKNTASKATGGVKIVDLGEELRVDPRQIVAVAKDMAMENAKVPASWVTAGQADRLRAKFGGQKELKAKVERKLKHFESALETPSDSAKAEASPKVHTPKLGKKTFESDRRGIFGVVASAGGVRVEPAAPAAKGAEPAAKKDPSHASSALAAATPAAPATLEAPATPAVLAVPVPPAKKFIEIKVAPPIRREGGVDSRFGVIAPAPVTESAKKDSGSGMWNKLNDGHKPVDFSAPSVPATPVEAAKEPVKEEAAAPETVLPKTPEPVAPAAKHAAAAPAAPSAVSLAGEYTPPKKIEEEVPVKWQPSHKAYGSKVKLKAKKLKQLSADSGKHKPAAKETSEHKHVAKPAEHKPEAEHKHKAARAPEKSEGVLKRLIRTIFKK